MNYLIDTHILIWYAEGNTRLKNSTLTEMRKPSSKVFISHSTFWEMTIKSAIGKMEFATPISQFQQLIVNYKFQLLGFEFHHYEQLETLPQYHNDPFDRMLISQAIAENFTIITQDQKFALYESSVKILWN